MKVPISLILFLFCFTLVGAQDNPESKTETEYLIIGEKRIEYIRSFYTEDNVDFVSLDYKNRESKTIETLLHRTYLYAADPDDWYRNVAVESIMTNRISINDYYGELKPRDARDIRAEKIYWLTSFGNKIPFEEFEIIIASKKKFVQFRPCDIAINGEFDFELSSLESGDYIIIRELKTSTSEYMDAMSTEEIIGYWIIK
jgi:hypothetical protein